MKCPTCGGFPNDRCMVQGAPPPIQRVGPGDAQIRYDAPWMPCGNAFHEIAEPARGVGDARENNPGGHDLRRDTLHWIDTHPIAAQLFLRYAREIMAARKARGSRKGFGVKYLMERVRYECDLGGWKESDYLLNNNMTPYLGRWLVQQEDGLKKFLKFRTVKYKAPTGNTHADPSESAEPEMHWQEGA